MAQSQIEKILSAKKKDNLIGVDGGKSTGIAIRTADNILHLHTMDFWTAYDFITNEFTPKDTAVFVEDPSKNKPVFVSKYNKREVLKALKIAQDVGGVKRESTLLINGLEREGFTVIKMRPKKKKWSHKLFCKISGWPEKDKTNEHQRDAARLIINR